MTAATDRKYMQQALKLAEKGRFQTTPNPMVGAVVVKNGRVIGQGYHRKIGGPHAEINALRSAKTSLKGATLYVNLEPCCHNGRTGPCCKAVIEAGIARVVAAAKDPDPRINGRGLNALRRAGIKVETGLMRKEAVRLNERFYGYHQNGRPWIVLKTAQTLDGRIATVTGDSKWISGPHSLKLAHALRAEADGLVVGGATVRADNPRLTTRRVSGSNPYRIILSDSLEFPRSCRLLNENDDYKTIVATSESAARRMSERSRNRNLIYWHLKKERRGYLDVKDLIAKADAFGLHSLLIEGGSRVATSFWRAGLVDKYVVVTAPLLLGAGKDSIGDLEIRRLAGAIRMDRFEHTSIGRDCLFVGYPNWEEK